MLYTLYRGLTDLAGPLVPILLDRRQAAGKEDPVRRGERMGIASQARPEGPLAWVHAASVGEALSVQVLIRRMLETRADLSVLVTTGTVTSAKLMAERLPPRALHQYAPLDRLPYARRFLDHWRPDLVLWVESEIWPNLLTEIGRRGIPAAMVNARMSARSVRRWRRFPGAIRRLLGVFQLILPWSEEEGEKLRALGAGAIGPAGNLKFSADPPAADAGALAALRSAVGGRPLWLAASTHDGEDALCAAAHAVLAAARPDLLTVIAPRHPSRGEQILAVLEAGGLRALRRATGALPGADTAVYVADTLGEMGVLMRLAPIVFIGGSLVPHGGHNPIEAAQLGAAILYGPHMTNFPEITGQLEAAGGGLRVDDGRALTAALGRLIDDPAACRRLAEAARRVAERNRGVIDRAMAALAPVFDAAWRDRAA